MTIGMIGEPAIDEFSCKHGDWQVYTDKRTGEKICKGCTRVLESPKKEGEEKKGEEKKPTHQVCVTCGNLTRRSLCTYCGTPTPRFLKPDRETLPANGVFLGNTKDGYELKIPPEVFSHHFAFYGVTGQGKTRLAMKLAAEAENSGIQLVMVDVESEWRNVIPYLKNRTEYYSAGKNLKVNPFELKDTGLVTVLLKETIFRGIEAENQDISPQMNYVLQKCIAASKSIPELIENITYFQSDESLKLINPIRTKTALLVRLEPYRSNEALKEIFYCHRSSIDLSDFEGRNIVIDLHEIERRFAYRVELRLIYNTIAIAVLRNALAREPTDKTTHMFIADEAQLLAPRILQKAVATDTWATTEFATRLRKRGQSLVVISQSPSNIEPDIARNCQTEFVFKLQDPRDTEMIAHSFGCHSYKAMDGFTQALTSLKQREAIVKTPFSDEPFSITSADFTYRRIADVELAARMPEVPINFTTQEFAFLKSVRERPFISVVERITELGWRRERYEQIVDALVERGTMEKQRVKLGEGTPRVLYQLRGKIPSVKHEFYVHWIAEQLKAKGIECTTSWTGPDIWVRSHGACVNVELGTSDMEHNILTARSQFQKIIVCSDDEDLLERLSAKFQSDSVLFSPVEDVPSLFSPI